MKFFWALYYWIGTLPTVAVAQLACNIDPIDGSQLEIGQWDSSSGWKKLTDDAVGSGTSAVRVKVLNNGSAGNTLNLLNNWGPSEIAWSGVDWGTIYVSIPPGTQGSLQFWIDHAGGSPYEAEVKLCTGASSTLAPTPNPTVSYVVDPFEAIGRDWLISGDFFEANPTPPSTPSPTPYPLPPPTPPPIQPPIPTSCDLAPLSGVELTIPIWHGSSGWKSLIEDASTVCKVDVTVLSNSMTGNIFHMLNNWDSTPIASQPMDTSGSVTIPSGTTGSLQYYIEHAVGGEYEAQVTLCTSCGGGGPPSPQTPTTPAPVQSPVPPPVQPPVGPPINACTSGDYSAIYVPQPCLPQHMGASESDSFGGWRGKINGDYLGTSSSGEDCRDLHDRYWVKGDDGKAYHTWHPPTADGCVFRHEHGDDGATSNIFAYSEGYPPFGYVAGQWDERDEDHFGHKVVVANDIRLAIGERQNAETVWDAGITCQWFSKLHQGTYSADAFSNDLHEYIISVKCDDTQFGDNTAFSIKVLLQWGSPNQFMLYEHGLYSDAVNEGVSMLTLPWNGQPDPIPVDYAVAPNAMFNNGGLREQESFTGVQWKSWTSPSTVKQPELWSGPAGGKVDIPNGGSISLAPYYIVKNPSRYARPLPTDPSKFVVKRTVDWCYDESGNRIGGGFCSLLPPTHPGPDYYKSEESPFKGTVRALNFKNLELRNDGGPTEFCTDVFGQNPTNIPCDGPGQIRQRASAVTNYWKSQDNAANPCVQDVLGVCHHRNLAGSIERWTFGYDAGTGLWEAERKGAVPQGGAAYLGAGIGYEWIINHGNAEGVRVPN